MTVKVFVPHDGHGRELPPTHTHETWGALDLIRRIWDAYADDPYFAVAIMANLELPEADFLVITNRGLGIVELKDQPGIIDLDADGSWTFTVNGEPPKRISGGQRNGRKRLNPHEQVQQYAYQIYGDIHHHLAAFFLAGMGQVLTNTAVCFTHPQADIRRLRSAYDIFRNRRGWERFQMLIPRDIVKWVYAISFAGNDGRKILSDEAVFAIPKQAYSLIPSRNMEKMMATKDPVGYLTLVEQGRNVDSFPLYPGSNEIGRDPKDIIALPVKYTYVSRRHARILHSDRGTFIEDLSTHGTFVDGQKVEKGKRFPLVKDKHQITLCAQGADVPYACVLTYTKQLLTTAVDPPVS